MRAAILMLTAHYLLPCSIVSAAAASISRTRNAIALHKSNHILGAIDILCQDSTSLPPPRSSVNNDRIMLDQQPIARRVDHHNGDLSLFRVYHNAAMILYHNSISSTTATGACRDENGVLIDLMETSLIYFASAVERAELQSARISRQDRVDIMNDYGIVLRKANRGIDAIDTLRSALLLNPNDVALRGNLASALKDIGDLNGAIHESKAAISLNPKFAPLRHNLGLMLQITGDEKGAIEQWKMAIEIDPFSSVQSLCSLGHAEGIMGNTTGAALYYEQALGAARHHLSNESNDHGNIPSLTSLKLLAATADIPVIYESVDHMNIVRKKYESNLRSLLEDNAGQDEKNNEGFYIADPMQTIGSGSLGYYIIYQGRVDIDLRRLFARVYWKASPQLQYCAPFLLDAGTNDQIIPGNDGRIRVGFHGSFLHHHSVGLLLQGVIANIDRSKFHVLVFFQNTEAGAYADDVTNRIRTSADTIIYLPKRLDTSMRLVAAQELDVLVYSEVGMDGAAYFLPFSRLAKRTVLFWGHAVTSGISNFDAQAAIGINTPHVLGGIDYFVSSNMFERDASSAQQRYSERLYLMQGLTTYFYPPIAPKGGLSRSDFGLPIDGNIYLCPQVLYKLHPDFDAIVVAVLNRDIHAHVVFPVAQRAVWTDLTSTRLIARINKMVPNKDTASDIISRIKFVPRMDFDVFNALAKLANVVLDPFPVGGGRSSFEIFSVDTPIVMLYNRTSILQLTYGMYKTMDIMECVAYSADEFVQTAIHIGSSRYGEQKLRRRIGKKKHLLYESSFVIEEWNYFLSYISNQPRPTGNFSSLESLNSEDLQAISLSDDMLTGTGLHDSSLLFAAKFRDKEMTLLARITQPGVDYTLRVAQEIADILEPEPLKRKFFTNVLLNGERRYNEEVVSIHPVRYQGNNTYGHYDIVVRHGDDLAAVATYYALQYGLNMNGITRILTSLVNSTPQHSTSHWIERRRMLGRKTIRINDISNKNDTASPNRCFLTVALTTCRRLNLFQQTMRQLTMEINSMNNEEICEIIVVDDNSSDLDRSSMIREYPDVSFTFKSKTRKGHAGSLNYILRSVQTRYLLYLEDDWLLLSNITSVISDAMTVLRNQGENTPIAQVLLNDQSSRDCAEGKESCAKSEFKGVAGWAREADSSAGHKVKYLEHEFGIAYHDHQFSYWPGFSLNPAIWDLERMTNSMGGLKFDENDIRFEQSFAISALDAGLTFAHLPQLNFRHTGASISSYVLNGHQRPWD